MFESLRPDHYETKKPPSGGFFVCAIEALLCVVVQYALKQSLVVCMVMTLSVKQ